MTLDSRVVGDEEPPAVDLLDRALDDEQLGALPEATDDDITGLDPSAATHEDAVAIGQDGQHGGSGDGGPQPAGAGAAHLDSVVDIPEER